MRPDLAHLGPSGPGPQVDAPLRVGIAPTPDFTLMSLSCFVEFLRLSADERDYSRQLYCAWDLLSHDDRPILSSCGFPVLPTRRFGDPRDYDYVVVHGGVLHGATPVPEELLAFVGAAVAARVPVIGLCTGQFVLARLGLLDGLRCAVHFSMAAALRQMHPEVVPVTDRPVVRDGGVITCPGGLAAVNLAMQLVTELTRLFAQHLRTPPALYWRRIRLEAAHWLVLNSSRSIARIAHECGFTDSSHLIRWFRRAYGVTPSRLRAVHRELGVH